jgi:hypothetical protein
VKGARSTKQKKRSGVGEGEAAGGRALVIPKLRITALGNRKGFEKDAGKQVKTNLKKF